MLVFVPSRPKHVGSRKMAHIVGFTVSGLVGRQAPFSCRLNEDINVFFGLNGSGKTSILKILQSAMSSDTKPLRTVRFNEAKVDVHSTDYATTFHRQLRRIDRERSVVVQTVGMPDSFRFADPIRYVSHSDVESETDLRGPILEWTEEPGLRKGSGPHRLKHLYLSTARLYANAWRALRHQGAAELDDEMLNEHFQELVSTHWRVISSEMLEAVQVAQQRGLVSMLNEVLTAQQPKEVEPAQSWQASFERVERFVQRQDLNSHLGDADAFYMRFKEDPLLRRIVAHVDAVETKIDAALQPATRLQELIDRLFSGEKRVSVQGGTINVVDRADNPIGLSTLSSGEKHVLRILVSATHASGGPIIIDEPELSLHIDWQRDLIGFIREVSPQSQIIVATHSPEIMANVADSKIFRL